MQTILIMSLTGSIMFLVVLLFRPLFSKYAMFRLQYLLLKITAFYFIVPLIFMKSIYEWSLERIFQRTSNRVPQFSAASERIGILISENRVALSYIGMIYFAITIIWLAIGFFFLIRYFYNYRKYLRMLRTILPKADNEALYTALNQLKEELSVKADIQLLIDPSGSKAFYIGITKPIIVIPDYLEERKANLILRHELMHIKHKDLVVKSISLLVLAMNWFNPLAYYLVKMITETSEAYCDESVVKHFDKEQKKEYILLILELATEKNVHNLYVSALSDSYKSIKRRMNYIMNARQLSKRIKRGIVACSVIITFSCTLTAFAYENPIETARIEGENGILGDQMEEFTQSQVSFTGSQESLSVAVNDSILYENQFVDENGNIYNADKMARRVCDTHPSVTPGYYQQHYRPGDGSCVVKTFNATRCTKCDTIIIGSLISENNFPKCIH